ncbi:hypothetical protein B9Q09_02030 [Candidatus Marsarchaeota G2 archaeon ECH_B_SAG-C16]|uniref:Uncharacterized protein n=2 Tax=Candidatus Marsarchaeota group 2 TaxID=2203771 RepID=A0A2R6BD49_9ARCH|nr:MAG: hypothetical protein B9Q09_02030 [Candidatus Marsarchaeota G2 archaeon ECH_B_SAG-C16]
MRLGILGSDKLVTTTNALMYEVFAGVVPDEMVIFTEDPPKTTFDKLSEALLLLGVKPKIRYVVLGEDFSKWGEAFSQVDIVDVTPGRKITALIAASTTKGKVRYAYLKEEVRGYRVLGYVPLQQIRLIELPAFKQVAMSAKHTVSVGEATLDREGLTAMYNLYTLLGEVSFSFGSLPIPVTLEELLRNKVTLTQEDQQYFNTCIKRAGYIQYKEEKEIAQTQDTLTFDTNVYIELGERVLRKARKTHPLRSVYDELDRVSLGYNKRPTPNEAKFLLGMADYTLIHGAPPPSYTKRSGDVGIIEEAMELKKHLEALTLVTLDQALAQRAKARGIRTIHLHTLRKAQGDVGELLRTLAQYTDIQIYIGSEQVASVKREDTNTLRVAALEPQHNYARLVQILQKFIRQ